MRLLYLLLCCSLFAFTPKQYVRQQAFKMQQSLKGAWQRTANGATEVLLFADGYCSYTFYNEAERQFNYTLGGPFDFKAGQLVINLEFNSLEPQVVGEILTMGAKLKESNLVISRNNTQETWTRIDEGSAPLSGNWHITRRMQEGVLQQIHQMGTRKTVKLLSGSRFQWVAIDPGAKGFYGTGGGSYTFKDGIYKEHIEFFSRDSSRVGATLNFSGVIKDGAWHHSGTSSRGDDIYEVWARKGR